MRQDDAAGAPAPGDTTADALERAVRELEAHVARGGWDAPVRVFSLVRTARAIVRDPRLRHQLPADRVADADADPEHVTSVEQDGIPEADTIEELLAGLAWPASVDGAAVVLERVVVPAQAEAGLPEDRQAAVEQLMAHPGRQDVRIAAGVLRDGTSACAVRSRRHDEESMVASGPDLVPSLVAALRATLED